jgi:hypothetical protein
MYSDAYAITDSLARSCIPQGKLDRYDALILVFDGGARKKKKIIGPVQSISRPAVDTNSIAYTGLIRRRATNGLLEFGKK